MKTLFIPAKLKLEVNEEKIKEISRKLPKEIAIVYSIQYENYAKQIKEILDKTSKITRFSQVLGCSKLNFSKNTKAILLISDGKFHAISLASETKLPIYIVYNNKIKKISDKEIKNFEKKQKVSYINYLNANKIGILISTKPRQEKLKKALQIKNKIKDKETYLFISNNINTAEFENFPEISSWINTACPRLDMEDSRILNVDKIK
jgi:2-(3-amino-3-carboxypropyl)histidine synthase